MNAKKDSGNFVVSSWNCFVWMLTFVTMQIREIDHENGYEWIITTMKKKARSVSCGDYLAFSFLSFWVIQVCRCNTWHGRMLKNEWCNLDQSRDVLVWSSIVQFSKSYSFLTCIITGSPRSFGNCQHDIAAQRYYWVCMEI